MKFNWSKALQGASMGALQGYTSVLQGEMEQEWYREQQKIQEERQLSLYKAQEEMRRNDPAYKLGIERDTAQLEILKSTSGNAISGSQFEREKFEEEKKARLASQQNESRRLQLAEEEATARKQDRELEQKIPITNEYVKNKETGEIEIATREKINSPLYVILTPEEKMSYSTKEKQKLEQDTLKGQADFVVTELKNAGFPEEQLKMVRAEVITGLKLTKDKFSGEDAAKAMLDIYKADVEAGNIDPEDPKSAAAGMKRAAAAVGTAKDISDLMSVGGGDTKVSPEQVVTDIIKENVPKEKVIKKYGEEKGNILWSMVEKQKGTTSTTGALTPPPTTNGNKSASSSRNSEEMDLREKYRKSKNMKNELATLERIKSMGNATQQQLARIEELKSLGIDRL